MAKATGFLGTGGGVGIPGRCNSALKKTPGCQHPGVFVFGQFKIIFLALICKGIPCEQQT